MSEIGVHNTPGSNFWRGPNRVTGEHDFQSRKTTDFAWKVKILTASTPGEAKRLGRACPIRPDWENVKIFEMKDVVLRKALTEQGFVDWLLSTDDANLVEYNTWHDNIWGVCTCESCKGLPATNYLGQILMELRALIQSYGTDPS